jgi:tRNA nucleotidyltransferase (CCA-adding enzyme)
MSSETDLREKLRKIEALFAGATFAGEKGAAGAAAERIRAQLEQAGMREQAIETQFSLTDPWSRRLFVAMCRRYGLQVYRYPRMKRQTLILRAPKSFVDRVLWPEFQQINTALSEYLAEATDRVIREEVFGDTGEAEEVREPARIR